MPPKKKPGKRGRPKGRKPTYPLFVRLDPALGEMLEAYVGATEPKPSTKSVVSLALQRYLASVGYWPPPAPPEEGKPKD